MDMRKYLLISLAAVLLLFPMIGFCADDPLQRQSAEVQDVFQPYESDWVISPDEEPENDEQVSNAPECDIKGVISCYDADYFRVDIILNHPVSFKWQVWYGIALEYANSTEYYAYCPTSKKFIFLTEKDGKFTDQADLEMSDKHTAGITSSGDAKNSDIYFILNKNEHLEGEEGKRYFLTSYFFSGFIDKDDKWQIADDTPSVDLEFTM